MNVLTRDCKAVQWLAVLGVLLLLQGCVGLVIGAGDQSKRNGKRGAAAVDAEITHEVKRALVRDGRVTTEGIRVSTASGVVTLRGRVANAGMQQRAVRVSRQVAGVKDVHSLLAVHP